MNLSFHVRSLWAVTQCFRETQSAVKSTCCETVQLSTGGVDISGFVISGYAFTKINVRSAYNFDILVVHFGSVGIATDYGLDCPESNPGLDKIFRPTRPALTPTQPTVKWVPGLSRG